MALFLFFPLSAHPKRHWPGLEWEAKKEYNSGRENWNMNKKQEYIYLYIIIIALYIIIKVY